MKSFLAVLRRELAERRLIVAGAAVLGIVPLAAPLLPLSYHGPDVRSGTALALALIVSFILAVLLGSSVIARDLGERRLGFYFTRPLPAWAIWSGKLAAAAVLALGAGLLVLLPAFLLGDRLDPGGYWAHGGAWEANTAASAALWAGCVVLLLLLSNAASVMVRSRSPWLLLDLMAGVVVAAVLWVDGDRLFLAGAAGALVRSMLALLAAAILALAAASAVQVMRGRIDLHRGHRLLSLTLWSLLGISALAVSAYAAWVLSAGPEDLEPLAVIESAPAGDWVLVEGEARQRAGFAPIFLLDTASGRSRRIRPTPWFSASFAFSRDGRQAAWLEADARSTYPIQVYRMDLDRPGARPVQTPISFAERIPMDLELSADGHLLAALYRERLLVQDLRDGRLLLSAQIPADTLSEQLRFLGPGVVRYYGIHTLGALSEERSELLTLDFDLAAGRAVRSFRRRGIVEVLWAIDPSGDRILLRAYGKGLRIVDLVTGWSSPLLGFRGACTFLSDGRLLAVRRQGGQATLHLLDRNGVELRRIPLPDGEVHPGGQPAPGMLWAGFSPPGTKTTSFHWTTLAVDLERGTWKPVGPGLPAGGLGMPPGSIGSRLLLQRKGRLLRIDPATGQTRVVLAGHGS